MLIKVHNMGKNCEFCTEWQEHWYWSHMADENKHFFKFMVGDFTESMSIPDEFAKNFNGHISEEVNLKFPSGKSWSIEVASDTGDAVLLRSGWKDGPSSFDVLMLDSNGCEKTSPHPVENHGRETAQNSAGVGGHNHAFSKTQDRGPPIDGEDTGKSIFRACQRDLCHDIEQAHLAKEGYEDLGLDDDGEAASAKTGYYFCKNGPVAEFHLTEEDKEEILIVRVPLTNSMWRDQPNSPNPVFVQVMHTGHGISSEFAGKYMGAVGREIVLKRAGRRGRWHARFVSGDYCQGLSGCGWRDFVRDTGILPKDVCLFELLEGAFYLDGHTALAWKIGIMVGVVLATYLSYPSCTLVC
ncbi:hypothetical protein BRADI_1g14492v3 [Brachypodium distachyon]|uniref:TF-B3 domain-containing protein n=1 Tax=Brachypodium distachyon TaxID=15368 RepID=A0A0Q3KSV3_BRADI|nr:hypothetical protein BRADI_1g14492v3 [Brachypodium distachyon]